jgi:hypothetical protein
MRRRVTSFEKHHYQRDNEEVPSAAKHFADHAEFENVISHITSAIDKLLDADKPHFAARMSHISSSWWAEKHSGSAKGSPLYHVADCRFRGLVQHLIMRRPQDVFARGGVRMQRYTGDISEFVNIYSHTASARMFGTAVVRPLCTWRH